MHQTAEDKDLAGQKRAKPSQANPIQAKPSQTKPSQAKSSQVKPEIKVHHCREKNSVILKGKCSEYRGDL